LRFRKTSVFGPELTRHLSTVTAAFGDKADAPLVAARGSYDFYDDLEGSNVRDAGSEHQ
jgi:hypothetical protein